MGLYKGAKSAVGYMAIIGNSENSKDVAGALYEEDFSRAQELSNYDKEKFIELAEGEWRVFPDQYRNFDGSILED